MPRIVCEPCVECRFTDCVTVCPADCFHKGETMVYINPAKCIDCDACVPECPVEAIYEQSAVPEAWKSYIELNAKESAKAPVINKKLDALPTASAKKAKLDAARDPDADRKKEEEAAAKARAERAASWEVKRRKYRPYLRGLRAKRETVLSEMEGRTERDRRYGRVFRIVPREDGVDVEVELPREVPDHWLTTRLNLAGPMPHYRTRVALSSPTSLTVEAWIEENRLAPLIGVVGAFPPRFVREISLPRPVRSCREEYRPGDRTLRIEMKE